MAGRGGCPACGRGFSDSYAWTDGGQRLFCDLDEHRSFWEVETQHARREVKILQEALHRSYETIRELRGLKP